MRRRCEVGQWELGLGFRSEGVGKSRAIRQCQLTVECFKVDVCLCVCVCVLTECRGCLAATLGCLRVVVIEWPLCHRAGQRHALLAGFSNPTYPRQDRVPRHPGLRREIHMPTVVGFCGWSWTRNGASGRERVCVGGDMAVCARSAPTKTRYDLILSLAPSIWDGLFAAGPATTELALFRQLNFDI